MHAATFGEKENGAVFCDDRAKAAEIARGASQIIQPPARNENDCDAVQPQFRNRGTYRRVEHPVGGDCTVVINSNGAELHGYPVWAGAMPLPRFQFDAESRISNTAGSKKGGDPSDEAEVATEAGSRLT